MKLINGGGGGTMTREKLIGTVWEVKHTAVSYIPVT